MDLKHLGKKNNEQQRLILSGLQVEYDKLVIFDTAKRSENGSAVKSRQKLAWAVACNFKKTQCNHENIEKLNLFNDCFS